MPYYMAHMLPQYDANTMRIIGSAWYKFQLSQIFNFCNMAIGQIGGSRVNFTVFLS